jgi:transposase
MDRTAWLQDRRMKKFLDVLGRYERRKLSALEAGEILGCSERQFRRWRDRYEEEGIEGLRDKRLGRASAKRVPADRLEWMLDQYRLYYRGWNVKHFHEHLEKRHGFLWSYTWTRTQLQLSGLIERAPRRGAHRRKRERKPCMGMMLHQDGSSHPWLEDQPALDLIVTMDDATSTIYSMFLVEEEGTASSLRGFLEVFSEHGLPSSVYTDRGSHYFLTPEAGGKVDKERPTQVGRALKQLGIEHIPAYSPEARGRSERMFGTLQDRLVKELKLAGVTDVETANRFFRDDYLPGHNARFAREPALPESAFVRADPAQLREILCVQEERIVARDNTVSFEGLKLQLPESPLRHHYVKARVRVHRYPDGALAAFHGPRVIARYTPDGNLVEEEKKKLKKAA